jgi:hypothetical protein
MVHLFQLRLSESDYDHGGTRFVTEQFQMIYIAICERGFDASPIRHYSVQEGSE